MSLSSEIGLLITNMIILSLWMLQFWPKGKKSKMKKSQMAEYIYIALSDLVLMVAKEQKAFFFETVQAVHQSRITMKRKS